MKPIRREHVTRKSAVTTIPDRPHCFTNPTAIFRLPARFSLSDNERFPAFVMKSTGYDFCLIASRIQISGVKDDRIMLWHLPKRTIVSRMVSTKILMSIEIGAIPASRAS